MEHIDGARTIIRERLSFTTEKTWLQTEEALGYTLAQDIVATMDQPPFRRSAMDGYAVLKEDLLDVSEDHPVQLQVSGQVLAGDAPFGPIAKGCAVRIMTGAPVPENATLVIPQEFTDYGEEEVTIFRSTKGNDNICPVGEDFSRGMTLARKGMVVDPYLIATCISAGVTEVEVRKPIRVSVLSTGSELVAPGEPLKEGKIYNSQVSFYKARLKEKHAVLSEALTLPDDPERILETIRRVSETSDLIITTGGVSVGKADYLPQVLSELKAEILFQGLKIKPGMPTTLSLYKGKPILSLSGNPFSSIAMFEIFYPELEAKLLGKEKSSLLLQKGKTSSGFPKPSKERRLVRGILTEDGVFIPQDQRNAQLAAGVGSNCLVDIPAGSPRLEEGESCVYYLLD